MKLVEMIPEFEINSQILRVDDLCSKDIDENLVNKINCKYFTNDEFSKLSNDINSFNIFHANVNGLECHFEELHHFLSNASLDFNAICISETSQLNESDFVRNVNINNYCKLYTTETLTGKGGVAIYIKDNLETIERNDLKAFAHTSNDELMNIILSLDEKKSTGPSSIPVKLLKIALPVIINPLCKLINHSFKTGIFPDAVKISKVIPIFKAGSTHDVNNYRPISLLSIFSKIIEKLMHTRLYLFIEQHKAIFISQFGFQKNKSTMHSLIEIVEKIKFCIEENKYGCGIFIDLKKAFDTVNHNILLKKLEHYGVRGTSLNWFSSYLNNRSQFVSYNNIFSKTR